MFCLDFRWTWHGMTRVTCAIAVVIAAGAVSSCGPPEAGEGPAPASAETTGLEQKLAKHDLPGLPDALVRRNDREPRRADLPAVKKVAPDPSDGMPQLPGALPDFASISDVRRRKQGFFDALRPLVRAANERVRKQRLRVVGLYETARDPGAWSEDDTAWLKGVCREYRVDAAELPSEAAFRKLLMRIDIVPPELALAQAAIESAWGTSRFTREGNNLFGQWCFQEGCGIVPRRRPEGATYEVAVFTDPVGSMRSYIRNLNSHPAYRQFRVLRYEQRLNGDTPDGHTLAQGLHKYAGIGMTYVDRLRTLIRQNRDLMTS